MSQKEQQRLAAENELAIDELPDEDHYAPYEDNLADAAYDDDTEYVWSAAGPPDDLEQP